MAHLQREREATDVLVIGAGAAGAVATRTLAEAGIDVLCLEQGDWVASSDFFGATPAWEITSQKTWHPNPNLRGRPDDYPIEVSQSDVNPLMLAAVGGSTVIYAAHWQRQHPDERPGLRDHPRRLPGSLPDHGALIDIVAGEPGNQTTTRRGR